MGANPLVLKGFSFLMLQMYLDALSSFKLLLLLVGGKHIRKFNFFGDVHKLSFLIPSILQFEVEFFLNWQE